MKSIMFQLIWENSKTYLKIFSIKINSKNKISLLVPKGFANAYLTIKKNSLLYVSPLQPSFANGIRYDDL